MKDSRNHELRQRVLSGEISPEKLVAMSPKDLAPQELNQWRQKKKEEFLEATVLDEGAAAKFSTAAALKQSEVLRQQRLKAELSEAAPIVVEPVGQVECLFFLFVQSVVFNKRSLKPFTFGLLDTIGACPRYRYGNRKCRRATRRRRRDNRTPNAIRRAGNG